MSLCKRQVPCSQPTEGLEPSTQRGSLLDSNEAGVRCFGNSSNRFYLERTFCHKVKLQSLAPSGQEVKLASKMTYYIYSSILLKINIYNFLADWLRILVARILAFWWRGRERSREVVVYSGTRGPRTVL